MIEKDTNVKNRAGDGYCTTRQAAEMLGLSLGTVQQMAESGALSAWKTAGGHRRVSIASVKEHLARRGAPIPQEATKSASFSLLIAEDDQSLQKVYAIAISSWKLPIAVEFVSNGFEGLLKIGQQAPDLLILDLMMPGLDGFEMIRVLRANPALSDMDIIVVTGMSVEDVAARGGLPADITVFDKPIPFHQLHGFIQAKLVQYQRSRF